MLGFFFFIYHNGALAVGFFFPKQVMSLMQDKGAVKREMTPVLKLFPGEGDSFCRFGGVKLCLRLAV